MNTERHTMGIRVARLIPWLLVILSISAVAKGAISERERELRRNVAWQVALDRVGISPGIIDGKVGTKTQFATREFQRVRGLKTTGELDSATAKALEFDPDKVFVRYTLQKSDFNEIGDVPSSWKARAKMQKLGHASIENVIAEKFHCHTSLLATINPSVNFARLEVGDEVIVPRVIEPPIPTKAASIEIDLGQKTIRVIDRNRQLAALFHCSVAASKSKLPTRDASVTAIAVNPTYTYDPKMWPEVKERVDAKLTIPPGPRNPVGRCWISLSLPGYGMHGTPNPELIGKTGSHGCFRLTNWDALRLAKMVEKGTLVHFTGHPDELARN